MRQRRVVGIIDANLFAEEILEAGDSEVPADWKPIAQMSPGVL